jgi:hypothetical protein
VRSTPAPAKYDEALVEALTPTRADVVDAERVALETLAARGAARPGDILGRLRRVRPPGAARGSGAPQREPCPCPLGSFTDTLQDVRGAQA